MQINLPDGVSASVVERASSTMDLARSYDGSNGFPHWILARVQIQGRGRRGRSWVTGPGSFAATLILEPKCSPLFASYYSFVMACALYRSLEKYVDSNLLSHKWPNDVLLRGGKVAGILIETTSFEQFVDRLYIGIGVNLGTTPKKINDTSFVPIGLCDVIGKTIAPNFFLENIAYNFCMNEQVLIKYGFAKIRDEWLASASHLGEIITADIGREQYKGYFESIDENGNLVLLTTGGKRVIPAADIYF